MVIRPGVRILVTQYRQDRQDGYGRAAALAQFLSALRSLMAARLRYS